jgi:hypothetical protein
MSTRAHSRAGLEAWVGVGGWQKYEVGLRKEKWAIGVIANDRQSFLESWNAFSIEW